jgi:hypothetical protein
MLQSDLFSFFRELVVNQHIATCTPSINSTQSCIVFKSSLDFIFNKK